MSEVNDVTITSWSRAGATWDDPALAEPGAETLRFEGNGRFYAGTLTLPAAGALVLEVISPRPLRLWLRGLLVLDEAIWWRSFQREVRAAVVLPVSAPGDAPFRVEVGERPWHRPSVDAHSPSRDRERVLAAVAAARPDALGLRGRVVPAPDPAAVPSLSLRFPPTQFVDGEGVVWQHVEARTSPGLDGSGPPTTGGWYGTDPDAPPTLLLASPLWPGAAREGTSDADRARGRRRFFVPIAHPLDTPAPLRAVGAAETRPEPVIEIARTLTLDVNGVPVPLPAYESLGRSAPRRAFRPEPAGVTEWSDDRAAELPEPVLPPEWARFADLYRATWAMLWGRVRVPEPTSGLTGAYISTGPGFPFHQFVWDTSFTTICAAYGHRATGFPALGGMDLLYARQFDGGYIHRETDVRDGAPVLYEPDFSPNPPILSVAEWHAAGLTGDLLRLARVYPALADNHRWIRANRLLPDGTYWTTGLANGLDNSPSLGDGYPDLTAQMAHDAETLARIARLLGRDSEADAWERERAETAAACDAALWDARQDIYSTSLPDGGHNPNKVVTAFWPLWAGIVPEERAAHLARHLKDPASFWRHHPLPSLAADSPEFVPGGDYWRGSVWAPTTYAAIKGFARAGYADLAREATLRHLHVLHEVWAATGHLWENYSSEAPSRPGSTSQPDYCWTALGPIALLLETLLGFEADALNGTLRWTPPPPAETGGPLGVRRLPLGAATVSVVRRPDGVIVAESDRPFTLEVRTARPGGAAVRRLACGAGVTRHAPESGL